MGCDCCKETDPKRYRECQSLIEKIASEKSSQDWRFRAPFGIPYTFEAKFFIKSKKEKEDWKYCTIPSNLFLDY